MQRTLTGIIALTAAFLPLAVASGQTLTIKTSDTLVALNQKWVEAYKAKHPNAAILVTSESTTATLAALADKKANLVIIPRSIRFKEAQACEAALGKKPAENKLAVSGLAVYINTNNPVKELTYDELYAIFNGQSHNWKEFDGGKDQAISVYVLATNGVPGELFKEEVMSGKGFSPDAHLVSGPDLLKTVAVEPQAIGFGALASAEGVQPLDIKRARSSTPVAPTEENIARRIYPISRYVFCYSNPAANQDEIKAYLDWIRSGEGQQAAKEAGFYALPASLRSSQ